jgi:hypothetical protein
MFLFVMADAVLTFEKIFVLVGGAGLGLFFLGLIWLLGKPPRPDDMLNRGFYLRAPRDVRFGAIFAIAGWGLAGITWLLQNG